jgi:hypothetical protein
MNINLTGGFPKGTVFLSLLYQYTLSEEDRARVSMQGLLRMVLATAAVCLCS